MRSKRFLAPPSLDRFDNWLLLNRPETWSARTHLVAYYGGIILLLIALVVYIVPDDPRTETGWGSWLLFTMVISIIGFVTWLIYLLRFNVFKRFGKTSGVSRLKTFLLYFAATGLIMLSLYVQPAVESMKAASAYPADETVRDINEFNLGLVQLEHNRFEHVWKRDTVTVRDTLPGHYLRTHPGAAVTEVTYDVAATDTTVAVPALPTKKGLIDTASFNARVRGADSLVRMNDSMYIFLECPGYIKLHAYGSDNYSKEQLLSSLEIYHRVLEHFRPPDRARMFARLQAISEKYYLERKDYYYYDIDNAVDSSLDRKYRINNMQRSIYNINERRDRWHGSNLQVLIRTWFYATLVLSLLVFVFRHSTTKTFFLSLLSAALIAIMSALFLALSQFSGFGFFVIILVWFGIFTAGALGTFSAGTRHLANGISINLFTLAVSFVPLVIFGLYISAVEERARRSGHYDSDLADLFSWAFLAEIVGVVLLLVLIPSFIHRVFRKWYALPEH